MKRKEAKALNLKTYNTGINCRNGHECDRETSNGSCIQCRASYSKVYRKRAVYIEYNKEYSKTDAGRKSTSIKNKLACDKYPNAHKSRAYYWSHRHLMDVLKFCELCSSPNGIEAHHYDYNLPLSVVFLCKKCHTDWHMNSKPINRISGIFTK